jgi:hypothetical protein
VGLLADHGAIDVLSSRVLLHPTDPERSRVFYRDTQGLAIYREFQDHPRRRGDTVGRRWTWVAWAMVAVFVACMSVGALLSVANGNFQRRPGFSVALTLAFTAFMVVGAVLVAHRPGNAIGWLFSAIGLLTATGTLALDYAEYAYVTRPGSLPGALLAAWYQWWWLPMFALILVVTPLLFPPAGCCRPAGARLRWRPRSRLQCWPWGAPGSQP